MKEEEEKLRVYAVKNNIKNIIKNDRDSTLELDDEGPDFINFVTRENGDVGEELTSQIDLQDAYNIKTQLKSLYDEDVLDISVDEVDEWVYLNIKFI